ncbi:uncharacterized protein LOC108025685 [Drosophila biarmipes]|uniref:uncharacterized protein LOC108025685 n=1 Tax=Drosophila biarmipes TaxID=125945 RepID=UPI001CDB318A|nr:uncharacterized protein LOC108025685 [Drosophila biarmipes]
MQIVCGHLVFLALASDQCENITHTPRATAPVRCESPNATSPKETEPADKRGQVRSDILITAGQSSPVVQLVQLGLQRLVQALLVLHPADPESLLAGCWSCSHRSLKPLWACMESPLPSPDQEDLDELIHWDVNCNGCGSTRLIHYRYKCLRCPDYDLCAACHENGVASGHHEPGHPFQCLLDRAARELHFAGERTPDLCADSYTCPLCGGMGLSAGDLMRHCQMEHRLVRLSVICPLCVAVPASNPNRVNNITTHLILWHPASPSRAPASPSRAEPLADFRWPQQGLGHMTTAPSPETGSGTATHHTLPSAQVPQVRFLLPRGRPPLAPSEDLSDQEVVEM